MSRKINVNPGQYKTAGRERQGEDILAGANKQAFAEQRAAQERWAAEQRAGAAGEARQAPGGLGDRKPSTEPTTRGKPPAVGSGGSARRSRKPPTVGSAGSAGAHVPRLDFSDTLLVSGAPATAPERKVAVPIEKGSFSGGVRKKHASGGASPRKSAKHKRSKLGALPRAKPVLGKGKGAATRKGKGPSASASARRSARQRGRASRPKRAGGR